MSNRRQRSSAANARFAGFDRPADSSTWYQGAAVPADDEAQLGVYGSAAHLQTDVALYQSVEEGMHLLQWDADCNCLVDRYDARLLLDDVVGIEKRSSTLQPNTQAEQELDAERYFYLLTARDADESTQQNDMAMQQQSTVAAAEGAGLYSAVGLDYNHSAGGKQTIHYTGSSSATPGNPGADIAPFMPRFALPEHIKALPASRLEHEIISETARFVRAAGHQMEIMLRVKQGSNAKFMFLMPHNELHPYFRFIVENDPQEVVVDAAPGADPEVLPAEQGVEPEQTAEHGKEPVAGVENAQDKGDAVPVLAPESSSMNEEPWPLPLPGLLAYDSQSTEGESEPSSPMSMAESIHAQAEPQSGTAEIAFESVLVPAAAAGPGAEVSRPGSAGPLEVQMGPPVRPKDWDDQAARQQAVDQLHDSAIMAGQAAITTTQADKQTQQATVSDMDGGSTASAQMARQPASALAQGNKGVSEQITVAEPPADVRAIISKLLSFIQRAGPRFEAGVRQKESNNPKFGFLKAGHPYHTYYNNQMQQVLGPDAAQAVIDLRPRTVAPAQPSDRVADKTQTSTAAGAAGQTSTHHSAPVVHCATPVGQSSFSVLHNLSSVEQSAGPEQIVSIAAEQIGSTGAAPASVQRPVWGDMSEQEPAQQSGVLVHNLPLQPGQAMAAVRRSGQTAAAVETSEQVPTTVKPATKLADEVSAALISQDVEERQASPPSTIPAVQLALRSKQQALLTHDMPQLLTSSLQGALKITPVSGAGLLGRGGGVKLRANPSVAALKKSAQHSSQPLSPACEPQQQAADAGKGINEQQQGKFEGNSSKEELPKEQISSEAALQTDVKTEVELEGEGSGQLLGDLGDGLPVAKQNMDSNEVQGNRSELSAAAAPAGDGNQAAEHDSSAATAVADTVDLEPPEPAAQTALVAAQDDGVHVEGGGVEDGVVDVTEGCVQDSLGGGGLGSGDNEVARDDDGVAAGTGNDDVAATESVAQDSAAASQAAAGAVQLSLDAKAAIREKLARKLLAQKREAHAAFTFRPSQPSAGAAAAVVQHRRALMLEDDSPLSSVPMVPAFTAVEEGEIVQEPTSRGAPSGAPAMSLNSSVDAVPSLPTLKEIIGKTSTRPASVSAALFRNVEVLHAHSLHREQSRSTPGIPGPVQPHKQSAALLRGSQGSEKEHAHVGKSAVVNVEGTDVGRRSRDGRTHDGRKRAKRERNGELKNVLDDGLANGHGSADGRADACAEDSEIGRESDNEAVERKGSGGNMDKMGSNMELKSAHAEGKQQDGQADKEDADSSRKHKRHKKHRRKREFESGSDDEERRDEGGSKDRKRRHKKKRKEAESVGVGRGENGVGLVGGEQLAAKRQHVMDVQEVPEHLKARLRALLNM